MIEKLKEWFKEKPAWLQEAAKRVIEKGKLADKDYDDLYQLCTSNSNSLDIDIPLDKLMHVATNNKSQLKIKSIGNIEGINDLSPKIPLDFGDENLSVVYGLNGSGKSGYVRILKNACGAKKVNPPLQNVYKKSFTKQKCTIEYTKGNTPTKVEWNVGDSIIDDLACVDIFDADCGKAYVDDENEVSYEPPLLVLFSNLVEISDGLGEKIAEEIRKYESIPHPKCPDEYKNTETGRWFSTLSAETTEQEIDQKCQWSDKHNQELLNLQNRISTKNPQKEATQIRRKVAQMEDIINNVKKCFNKLSDEKYTEIRELKERLSRVKNTERIAAERAFNQSLLKGVGNETWQQLWEYAKAYSQHHAYKDEKFPFTSNDALCVLCHQPLNDDAKKRLNSFEDFVKGEAKEAVRKAEKILKTTIEFLPEIWSQEDIATKLDASGLEPDSITQPLTNFYTEIRKRAEQLKEQNPLPDTIPPLPSMITCLSKIEQACKNHVAKAVQYEKDAAESNRDNLLAQEKDLKMKQFLSPQIQSIKNRSQTMETIKLLKFAKDKTNTQTLSTKKGDLSRQLITHHYAQRFNEEMNNLRAGEIKVILVKSKTDKGRLLHKLQLEKSTHSNPEEIFSEGENRIIALSIFLADVTGNNIQMPFIFDDPISSLDQEFEESVVDRLVELSKERQVIIFTHRISMLALLEDYSKKKKLDMKTNHLKKESWGAGEPSGLSLNIKKPKNALNQLIHEELPKSQKIYNNQGSHEYEIHAKSLCSNFRILIERIIEQNLLADIVRRYRRSVQTMNKIGNLAKINQKDCALFDRLMTKYSSYEHSQTDETPINLPKPDEMEKDFKGLKEWLEEFEKR